MLSPMLSVSDGSTCRPSAKMNPLIQYIMISEKQSFGNYYFFSKKTCSLHTSVAIIILIMGHARAESCARLVANLVPSLPLRSFLRACTTERT